MLKVPHYDLISLGNFELILYNEEVPMKKGNSSTFPISWLGGSNEFDLW